MNTRHHVTRLSNLTAVFHRSFTRSTLGLKLAQDMPPNQRERCWVNTTCMAAALVGLAVSFFSTRQLCYDPNSRCLLSKK